MTSAFWRGTWNEPGGFQYGYYKQQEPKNKVQIVLACCLQRRVAAGRTLRSR